MKENKTREYEQALKDERLLLEATMGKVKEYEKAMQRIDKKVHSINAKGLPKIESKLWEIKNIIDNK